LGGTKPVLALFVAFIENSFAQGLGWGYNNLEVVCLLQIMIEIQKEICRVEHRDNKCGESRR
jgi:hypothetical protein